jgi:hypothetical protein
VIFRQGHLSDQALTEAIATGDRPLHLDQCELCGDRAVELAQWLADIKSLAVESADRTFPAERLTVQQAQIMRRLEQTDEPARVIEFPRQATGAARDQGRRRVAPAWVGVAAAVGLVVGVIGGQVAARHTDHAPVQATTAPRVPAVTPPAPVDVQPAAVTAMDTPLLDLDLEGPAPESLRVFDEATPRLVSTRYASVR